MTAQSRVSDLMLERFAHGELDPEGERRVRAVLAADPAQAARLAALETSNTEILAAYPSHLMAVQIRAKAAAAEQRAPLRGWLPLAASLATAAVVVLCLFVLLPSLNHSQTADQDAAGVTRPKGDFLKVYRNTRTEPELLRDGASVHQGDELQLRYNAWEYSHGVIFSVDGRGQVTLHFPADKTQPTALDRPGDQSLPYAYRLDAAPKFERFFFAVSKRPIDVKVVLDAGAKLGVEMLKAPALPSGVLLLDEVLVYKR